MIGVSPAVPYEVPEKAELVLDTEREDPETLGKELADFVQARLRAEVARP